MEIISGIIAYVTSHAVELIAAGWAIEKVLQLVAKLTPWKWDDQLGTLLGNLLLKVGKKPV